MDGLYGEMNDPSQTFLRNTVRKITLGRHRLSLQDSIKMDLRGTACAYVDWVNLDHDMDQSHVSKRSSNFQTS
jgi:hypothetical protein